MFKILAEPQFTCEINISRPDSDDAITVDVTWLHLGTRDLMAWLKAADKQPDDATYLHQVMVGWGRFVGADSKPLPYSKEALAVLLATFPSAGRELVQAYYRRLTDARAKNW